MQHVLAPEVEAAGADAQRADADLAFQHHAFLADGRLVVGLVDFEATVRKTGRKVVEVDEVHLFHFNDAGLVQRFAHRADTWQHANAYLGR